MLGSQIGSSMKFVPELGYLWIRKKDRYGGMLGEKYSKPSEYVRLGVKAI